MSSIIQNKFHQVLGDGARLSKFNFILPHLAGSSIHTDDITYHVKSLTLPKMEHEPIKIMHKGRPIPIRGTTKFSQQFTVTFYMQESHLVKRFFESWMAMIEQRHYYYDPRKQEEIQRTLAAGGGRPDYMTWYNVDSWIEQRNFDGDEVTAVYGIKNTFPISVDPPTFSYDSVGQIAEQTVTFAYSHYMLHSHPAANPVENANIQNQLFYSTQKQEDFKEYPYELDRWKLINAYDNLDQTEGQGQEIYWRPYELARWDNNWNRWRETGQGANKNPGTEPRQFNPDDI